MEKLTELKKPHYRIELINSLIKKFNYETYLEIGIRGGVTFRAVNCKYKTGVDPRGNPTFKMTSDEFFKLNLERSTFDIIFIDGFHTAEQVLKDFQNSLLYLNENGTIVLHDCNPHAEYLQLDIDDPKRQVAWCGTVWKAIAELRHIRGDLSIFVVDIDHGLGVIRRGRQELYFDKDFPESLNWQYLVNHRKELLNLISVEGWQESISM